MRVLSSPRSRSWVRRILRRFRNTGTRPAGGYLKPSASMSMKGLGMRARVTVTTEGCSFSPPHGDPSEVLAFRILLLHAFNCLGHGSSTGETAGGDKSGRTRLGRADFTNRGDE